MSKNLANANKRLHILKFVCVLVPLVLALGVRASAAETTTEFSIIDENVDGVLSDFLEVLPDDAKAFADPYSSSDTVGLSFLIESVMTSLNGEMGSFVSFLLTLLGISLITSLVTLQDGEIGKTAKSTSLLVMSAVVVDKVFEVVASVGESLAEINGFFASMIPITTAVNTLGVAPGLATAQSMGMSITLQIYSFISGELLYSIVGAMLVLSGLSTLDGSCFGKINATVRKTFLVIIGALTAFIGATFSLQSLISASADSWALRGAKYATSGMIPIVGGSISSALATLVSGVSYAKGVIGGGAIAVIVTVAIAPLVSLIAYRLCFNIAIFFSGVCTNDGAEGVLSGFVSVFDALIAVYSLTAVIYLIQLAVFLKGGVSFA